MLELRATGASNALAERSRRPLRRATLARAVEVYRERFGLPDGRVRATFEIITMTAWAPHPSQPKPLRPGSATTRLADVLGKGSDPRAPVIPEAEPKARLSGTSANESDHS
jgi:hypothetical protein